MNHTQPHSGGAAIQSNVSTSALWRIFRNARQTAVQGLASEACCVAVVFALVTFAACWVQSPYWQACHYQDDLDHLAAAGKVRAGELSWGEFLCKPHNEHVMPLWKLWYYVQWRLFGLDAVPWHLCVTAMHLLSAAALYGIARRFQIGVFGAAVAAFLWAGAAIGQIDNSLILIASSHLGMAVHWLLLAMLCVCHMDRGRAWLWGLLTAGCMTAAVLTTGATLLLCPILPLQYVLQPRENQLSILAGRMNAIRTSGLQNRWAGFRDVLGSQLVWIWGACWLLPVAALTAFQLMSVLPAVKSAGLAAEHPDLLRVAYLAFSTHAIALANLLFWPIELHPNLALGAKAMFAIGIGGLALMIGSRLRISLFALLLLFSLAYCSLVYVARSALPDLVLLGWGRYVFLPTLVGCVLIGAIVDGVIQVLDADRRRLAVTALLSLAVFYLGHQRSVAYSTALLYEQKTKLQRDLVSGYDHLLRRISRIAKSQGTTIALPDHVVEFPFVPQKLSTFALYAYRHPLRGVRIVEPDTLAKTEVDRSWRAVRECRFAGTDDYRLAVHELAEAE